MFPTESPGNHRLEVTSGQAQHMGSLVTEDSVYRHTTPHCCCLLPVYSPCLVAISRPLAP